MAASLLPWQLVCCCGSWSVAVAVGLLPWQLVCCCGSWSVALAAGLLPWQLVCCCGSWSVAVAVGLLPWQLVCCCGTWLGAQTSYHLVSYRAGSDPTCTAFKKATFKMIERDLMGRRTQIINNINPIFLGNCSASLGKFPWWWNFQSALTAIKHSYLHQDNRVCVIPLFQQLKFVVPNMKVASDQSNFHVFIDIRHSDCQNEFVIDMYDLMWLNNRAIICKNILHIWKKHAMERD